MSTFVRYAVVFLVLALNFSIQAGDGKIELSQSDFASPPYVITNSGSYLLTENILITNIATHGISIQADHVTIDLNGFVLQGPGPNSGDGIYQLNTLRNLTVRNGSIAGWSDAGGIGLYTAGNNNQIDHVMVSNNGRGIYGGYGCLISQCTAYSNTSTGAGFGMDVGYGSTVINCVAYNNEAGADYTAYGISAGYGCSVINCTAYNNGGASTNSAGIRIFNASTISDCNAYLNDMHGIEVGENCRVVRNNSSGNVAAGIYVTFPDNRIEANNLTGNNIGLQVEASGNIIICNSASGNSSDYTIDAGNSVGEILSVSGSTITNSNPWANFEF